MTNYVPRAKRYRADEQTAQWQLACVVWYSIQAENMRVSDWTDPLGLGWDVIDNMRRAYKLRMRFRCSDPGLTASSADGQPLKITRLHHFIPRSTFAEMYRWVEAEKLTADEAATELARLVNVTDGTCASRSTLQRELQAHYGGGQAIITPSEAINALRRALLRLAAMPEAVPAPLKPFWGEIVKWLAQN